MKTGKSLVELAQELENIAAQKRDFVAPTSDLRISATPEAVRLNIESTSTELALNEHAFQQITDYTGVPSKYVERMRREAPALLEQNVNHWLHENNEPRMVRAVGNRGRAFLSNRYRRIDNEQILAAAFPLLMEQSHANNLRILSSEVTESRMYIQAAFPTSEGEIKVGDIVQAGFTLSNSENGKGAISVTPFIYRLRCLNGLQVPVGVESGRLRKTHLGRILEADEAREIFKDDTLEADDRALMLKVRDAIMAMSNPKLFAELIDQMRRAASEKIADPVAAVAKVAETYQLTQPQQSGLLRNLIEGADLSRWGLINAATALAHTAESYDQNIEYQQLGGRILSNLDLGAQLQQAA